jgi:uncharacterized Zn-finger protein
MYEIKCPDVECNGALAKKDQNSYFCHLCRKPAMVQSLGENPDPPNEIKCPLIGCQQNAVREDYAELVYSAAAYEKLFSEDDDVEEFQGFADDEIIPVVKYKCTSGHISQNKLIQLAQTIIHAAASDSAESESTASSGAKMMPYKCPSCSERFSGPKGLARHLPVHQQAEIFSCTFKDCDRTFSSAYRLATHINEHTGITPYRCDWPDCNGGFADATNLKRHQATIHRNEKPFTCRYCDKIFPINDNYLRHERTHTGERPYQCLIEGCEKSFSDPSARNRHMNSHTGDKPFVCTWEDCGAAYTRSKTLSDHINLHTGETPYACLECPQRFATVDRFKSHKLLHVAVKPIACTWPGCTVRFDKASRLPDHMRRHTGEKPCVCTWEGCDKRFATPSDLRGHQRVHTDERKFMCHYPNCGRTYPKNTYLEFHIAADHDPSKKLKCSRCPETFADPRYLRKHVHKYHPGCDPDAFVSAAKRLRDTPGQAS